MDSEQYSVGQYAVVSGQSAAGETPASQVAVGRRRSAVMIALLVAGLLFVIAVAAALALEPAAPAATDLSWQVIAAGGQTMSGPSYSMLSTTGQPVAGAAGGANHTLLSGFWVGFQETVRRLLLPFIIGNP